MQSSFSKLIQRLICIWASIFKPAGHTLQDQYSQKSALEDLAFIETQLISNHPGYHDNLNPNFRIKLTTELQKAKQVLTQNKGSTKNQAALQKTIQSFKDAHLRITFSSQQQSPSSVKKRPEFNYYLNSNQILWIKIPSFALNSTEIKRLKSLESVLQNQQFAGIVFDLQGNQGGNSFWADRLNNYLFGQDYAEQQRNLLNSKVYVDYRASQDNLNHVEKLLREYTNNLEISKELKPIATGMKKALKNGKIFYKYKNQAPSFVDKKHASLLPANIPLIAIIDSACYSATLDFLDQLIACQPQTLLVGQTSGADSLYMEVRRVALPSTQGFLIHPIKVFRNRKRGHNQPYQPQIKLRPEILMNQSLLNKRIDKILTTITTS